MIKNLKSLFFIEDEKSSKENDKSVEEPKSTAKKEDVKVETDSEPIRSGGKVDDKIMDALFNALEENNLQGFDYFEFKKSLNSLQKMVSDEAMRFKSAFATAATMGLTLDKLVETAKHYSGILDSERSKFNSAAKNQRIEMVEQRKEELELLKKTIENKKAQILEFNAQIKSHEAKLKELENGIENAVDKIEETQRNFERSFEHLKGQIDQDVEKMNKYLK